MAFNIGEQVRVKRYDEIPDTAKANIVGGDPHLWSKGKSRNGGKTGRVVDKLYSEAYDCFIYRVVLDGFDKPSRSVFTDECIEAITGDPTSFRFDIQRVGEKIRAILYRTQADGTESEVGVGYGYILHEGMKGIAQAASYAMKMIYKNTGWHIDEGEENAKEEDLFEKAQKTHEKEIEK